MPGPYEEMGFQLQLWVGNGGTSAPTQLTIATDIDYDITTQKGATTDRGTGGAPPITTENVTQRTLQITFTMNNDPDDAGLLIVLSNAAAGTPIAAKLITGSGTQIAFGDFNVEKKYNAPLDGPGTYDVTLTATKQYGRLPTLG